MTSTPNPHAQACDPRPHLHTGICQRAGYGFGFNDGVNAATEAAHGSIYTEVRIERARAHAKHAENSMEAQPAEALLRLAILTEEVGEVAREFNEGRHRGTGPDLTALRKELIQVAAMATAWADAIGCKP